MTAKTIGVTIGVALGLAFMTAGGIISHDVLFNPAAPMVFKIVIPGLTMILAGMTGAMVILAAKGDDS